MLVCKKAIQKRLVSSQLSFDQIPLRNTLRKKITPLPIGLSQRVLYGADFNKILMVMAAYDNQIISKFLQCNRYFRMILESELQNQTRNICFEL